MEYRQNGIIDAGRGMDQTLYCYSRQRLIPGTLDERQKNDKIRNLIQALKRKGIIEKDSDNQQLSNWILRQDETRLNKI